MEQSTIDKLIINKPYEESAEYWKYNHERRAILEKHTKDAVGKSAADS